MCLIKNIGFFQLVHWCLIFTDPRVGFRVCCYTSRSGPSTVGVKIIFFRIYPSNTYPACICHSPDHIMHACNHSFDAQSRLCSLLVRWLHKVHYGIVFFHKLAIIVNWSLQHPMQDKTWIVVIVSASLSISLSTDFILFLRKVFSLDKIFAFCSTYCIIWNFHYYLTVTPTNFYCYLFSAYKLHVYLCYIIVQ